MGIERKRRTMKVLLILALGCRCHQHSVVAATAKL
jgi:hypothetical protein